MSTSVAPSCVSSSPSWVLLHAYAQIGIVPDLAAANGMTSNKKEIFVSFIRERPPLPSKLSVDCPNGILRHPPRLLSMVNDLILFHIYVGSEFAYPSFDMSDFFIYRADPKQPSLKLIPHPRDRFYKIHEVGIVPREEDGYTIAALVPDEEYKPYSFVLYLLDSTSKDWTSRALLVESPQSYFSVHIPMELNRRICHLTSSVITHGGIIGWVDLYRGIVFCDMLSDKLTLWGVPVPLPLNPDQPSRVSANARRTRGISFINGYLRFVNLELNIIQLGGRDRETGWPSSRMKSWKITTWINKKWRNSFDDWQMDCTLQASEIAAGDYTESELQLSPLDGSKDEAKVEQRGLQNLFVSDPFFGLNSSDSDGDIVYLTARVKFMHPTSWVLAIDMKNKRVHHVVKSGRLLAGGPVDASYCNCSISNCIPLNTPAGGTSTVDESGGLGMN